jgi:hypothetical protein
MKFVAGLVVGVMLSVGGVAVQAQNERAMHPRIARAIAQLKDAVEYMKAAPHDFGGHRDDAIHASEEAIRQLHLALEYRAEHDRR